MHNIGPRAAGVKHRLCHCQNQKFKSSVYSRYFAEAHNEWRAHLCCLPPRNTAPKKHRSGGEALRHCVRFDRPGNRAETLRAIIHALIRYATDLVR